MTTKKTQHTPGPWRYDGLAGVTLPQAKNDHGEPLLMVRGRGASVAEVIPQQNAEANARLIAQAPAMYALLCELFAKLEEECDLDSNDRPNWAMRLYRAYGDRARAIATAIEGDR